MIYNLIDIIPKQDGIYLLTPEGIPYILNDDVGSISRGYKSHYDDKSRSYKTVMYWYYIGRPVPPEITSMIIIVEGNLFNILNEISIEDKEKDFVRGIALKSGVGFKDYHGLQ